MFRGRFAAIITKHSRLHLPHANWWQANRQHAQKTTVPLCWHCCSLAPFFFFFKALCLFLSFSLAPSVSLPLSSLRLLHLYHISSFFFFAPEVSFSPPPTLVSTPPLSVLSLLSAPAAMWSRRGSRVTEAGPFGVASSLSRLRGAAVHVR